MGTTPNGNNYDTAKVIGSGGGKPKKDKCPDQNPKGLPPSTISVVPPPVIGDDWEADNESITWWTDIGSYSPIKFGWHNYATGPNLICPAIYHCTETEMMYFLSRFAYPGQNPFEPVTSGGTYTVRFPGTSIPGGQIRSFVSDDGLHAVNKTLLNHFLYDGVAVRTVFKGVDDNWYVSTHSYGNNYYGTAGANNSMGPNIFNAADQQMYYQVIQDHQIQIASQ